MLRWMEWSGRAALLGPPLARARDGCDSGLRSVGRVTVALHVGTRAAEDNTYNTHLY